ncbi:hypothetical protein CFP75_05280 [Amycolatopsis alba DSM 44262]|uniref:Uncharacterized protein n=1 Tax=Amycolatopsis alba DSM 44262 TaxID=1125972 RepID=A0A229S6G5_AMYAL|nr:hypothetical protein CFP75_05280 [Amycolatopsis alba DSM 44262]
MIGFWYRFRRVKCVFDDDLKVCGACGVTQQHHGQACDPGELARIAELEREVDLVFAALVDPVRA